MWDTPARTISLAYVCLLLDMTGLDGEYDIGIYWSEDDSGPSLEQALRDQVGLRLQEKKGPVNFLIVEHLEKLPTEN
jgi:uncharacterized protein (TIGR03435 family)